MTRLASPLAQAYPPPVTQPAAPTPRALVQKYVRQVNRETAGASYDAAEAFDATDPQDKEVLRAWLAHENGTGSIQDLQRALDAWLESWRSALA